MKKLLAILLSFAMVFSLASVSAFAESTTPTPTPEPTNGSIVVNNYSSTVTYEIYKLLDLKTYDASAGAYSYKVNSDWRDFFTTGAGKDYFEFDGEYIKWKGDESETRVENFAKIALEYAEDNDIQPVKTTKNSSDFKPATGGGIVFEGLTLGYYLVDSTMGALCGLTTTNPNGVINAKNAVPVIDKQIQEDSTNQWGETNTADIGQKVNFRVTINVHAGAQNYVLHDNMNDVFNYIGVTGVEHIKTAENKTEILDNGTDYTVFTKKGENDTNAADDTTDGCTFEVCFSEDACNDFATNDKVVVYYEGMLNRNAVIGNTDDKGDPTGNKNTAWLSYGEGQETEKDETITRTYAIDLVKTDHNNILIDGAEFKIYDAATGGNEVGFVVFKTETEADGTEKVTVYRRARADETAETVIVADGKVRLIGLDNGTYYLEETKAPDGYNDIKTRQKFTISDANLDATFTDDVYSKGSGVQVVNKTGSMLPETGGMGTVMFITFGTIVVIGAGVLLVTKKRMSMIDD